MSQTASHSLSVVPLIAVLLLWALTLARRWPLPNALAGARVGLIWLLLTLGFEFGLGAARGVPLRGMLADYDLFHGHIWPLVPLAMALLPELARRLTLRAVRGR